MKSNYLIATFSLLLFVTGCQSPMQSLNPESPAALILKERQINKYELSVAGLPTFPPENEISVRPGAIGIYYLPARKNVQDDNWYRIVIDQDKMQYWVIRFDGISGRNDIFGPGKVPIVP